MSGLLRRLGLYAIAAWAALTLDFLLPRLMPGDPAAALFARVQGRLAPEAMAALKATFGATDAPLWQQYIDHIGKLASGDLGTSLAFYPAPVSAVVGSGLGWTVFLAGGALIIAFALGSALGAWAAWRRGATERILAPALSLLGAFPYFWLAMAAAWGLGVELRWFPARHAVGADVDPADTLAWCLSVAQHAALPALTLVLSSLGGWLLTMRGAMGAVLGEDSVRYALARGLSPRRILLGHALRGALLPSLTAFGMAIGFVLGGALLTEVVFSYPGTGYLLLVAVRAQDFPLLNALFLVITLAVLGANALVDTVTTLLDPRTRRAAE
jgi:peptide/nickel transport system permease protein